MTEWLHRTNVGRVVYARPKNSFHYRDTARILRNLTEYYDADDIDNIFLTISWAIQNLTARLYDEAKYQWDRVFSRLAGLTAAERLLLKIVEAMIETSRRYRSEYGIISFPWTKGKKSAIFPWFPEDLKPASTGPTPDPFVLDMLQARTRLTEYLKEVGYGEDDT